LVYYMSEKNELTCKQNSAAKNNIKRC